MNRQGHSFPDPLLALLREEHVSACDFDAIWKLARAHGIEPVMADGFLNRVDQPLPGPVRTEAEQVRNFSFVRNLQLLALLEDIKCTLEKAGLSWIAIKGPVFTRQYTGGLTLRVSSDLDVLVRPEDVLKADAALQRIGVRPSRPVRDQLQRRFSRSPSHEHEYYTASPRFLVELHWHLSAPCYHVIDDDAAFARAQIFSADDGAFPVLSPEDTFLHYTMHAFGHRWERLHHIKTLDWILKKPLDWDYVLATAEKSRKMRPVLLGLVLVRELFHAAIPDEVKRRIARDHHIPGLKNEVYRTLQRNRREHLKALAFKWRGLESAHDRYHLILRAISSAAERWG